LHLQDLTLSNFKNYRSQTLRLSPKLNCLTGLNGMGKTNVLDAVYYLCMCKSHFTTTDAHLVLKNEDFFRLEGNFILDNGKKMKVVSKIQPRKVKVFEHDGVAYEKLSEHIGKIPVVMIAPDDTALVTEGSEERRRLIDITLSQLDPFYLSQLVVYNKVLEQRNALLKQFAQQHNYNISLLEVYDEQLIRPAQYIFEQRIAFTNWLAPQFQAYYKVISADKEQPNCFYESKLHDNDFQKMLVENREKDRILQRTTSGIHRDDLVFTFNDNQPAKRFASQGQLKSFLLAIKLAQYEVLRQRTSKMPILLLDDIFDKLDAERVAQLLSLLAGDNFGQLFITDTQKERTLNAIGTQYADIQHFEVENGLVKTS
jgi:DNA replication and repair protein RecF